MCYLCYWQAKKKKKKKKKRFNILFVYLHIMWTLINENREHANVLLHIKLYKLKILKRLQENILGENLKHEKEESIRENQ